MLLLLSTLLFQSCPECYMPKDAALRHAVTKTVISSGTYVGLRALGVNRSYALVGASIGVFTAGKVIERSKGHTFPRGDLIHDMGWHILGVAPFAGRTKIAIGAGAIGIIIATRKYSSPRW